MKNTCRFCKSEKRITTIKLGNLPISNDLINNKNTKIKKYPLNLFICKKCYLAQIENFVPKTKIFNKKYKYFSSYSNSWLDHGKKLANLLDKKFHIKKKNLLVLEIASNDGYLLKNFKEKGIKCFGVEPSYSVAKEAIKKKIKTYVKFFNQKTAIYFKKKKIEPDIILALNVIGHVPDLNSFIKGIDLILKKEGILIIEIPYFINLIKKNQIDTIYHEHYSYFSITSMMKILKFHNLKIFKIQKIDTHGGSIRYFVSKIHSKFKESNQIKKIKIKEEKFLNNYSNYKKFKYNFKEFKKNIKIFINKIKKKDKKILGYGAAAKATILTNLCQIDSSQVKFIIDRNKEKNGLFIPGSKIEIKSETFLKYYKPAFIIIFVWNIASEIKHQLSYIKSWGAKMYTLYPKIKKII